MKIAVYAGSFDPITSGHENVILRASRVFQRLIIAIGKNSSKKALFSVEERIDMIHKVCGPLIGAKDIVIESFDGLLVEHCVQRGATVIIRGLRAASDFEYELGIAHANATQAREVETVFLATQPEFSFVSSSVVKEIASHGGNVRAFVSPHVEQQLWSKLGRKSPIESTPAT